MKTIILKPFFHRGNEQIGICFENDAALNLLVRKIKGVKWSKTFKCWYLPLSREYYNRILQGIGNDALTDTTVLKEYLIKRDKKKPVEQATANKLPVKNSKSNNEQLPVPKIVRPLSAENKEALRLYDQQLVLKSYADSTAHTYRNEFMQLLNILGKTPASEITIPRLKDYLQYCFETLKLTESTIHSRINALKIYYEQVLGKENFFWEIPRPNMPFQLPGVISKEQIATLINSIKNIKHKTIIMLAYACGLMVSEVVKMKIKQIDSQRMLIFIARSKKKKDRVVGIGPNMLVMLRDYYKKYKPTDFLFEGQKANRHLSPRSIQAVMQRAKAKAGILQEGNMHLLRHSFATHLLDKGIDVVFIQKMLGHNDIRTTLRYLHVTNKDLAHIISPLEDIDHLLKK